MKLFQECFGNVSETFRECFGNVSGMFRTVPGVLFKRVANKCILVLAHFFPKSTPFFLYNIEICHENWNNSILNRLSINQSLFLSLRKSCFTNSNLRIIWTTDIIIDKFCNIGWQVQLVHFGNHFLKSRLMPQSSRSNNIWMSIDLFPRILF